ncbi:hypothetical protein HDV00_010828 [Rhizophlyctis rosea]|nr:hypothetical protein HDV00_010828 [Rhizophlyctis rosea]
MILKVASRYYEPPRILVGFRWHDYGFNEWNFGCRIAGMIFHMAVLFRDALDVDPVHKIIADLIPRSEFINGIRSLWLKRCNIDGRRRLVVVKVETELPGLSGAESGMGK